MRVEVRTKGSWQPVEPAMLDQLIESARFVTWYDTIQTDAAGIGVLDLAIPAFLDAVPNFKELLASGADLEISEVLARATRLLSDVPQETDLWEWDVDRSLLKVLFQATTGGLNRALPGFGPAKCTKMLHRKRPRAIPIIDSWIREAWSTQPSASWSTDDMVEITMAMRKALGGRTAELRLIRDAVGARWGVDVSLLRAYDILSYLWHQHQLAASKAM